MIPENFVTLIVIVGERDKSALENHPSSNFERATKVLGMSARQEVRVRGDVICPK